ncbi:hypothetical protein KM043_003056 [Ampulex compressa]|nr:hypothetical protein KM043_003056 [Ampulex compressa]
MSSIILARRARIYRSAGKSTRSIATRRSKCNATIEIVAFPYPRSQRRRVGSAAYRRYAGTRAINRRIGLRTKGESERKGAREKDGARISAEPFTERDNESIRFQTASPRKLGNVPYRAVEHPAKYPGDGVKFRLSENRRAEPRCGTEVPTLRASHEAGIVAEDKSSRRAPLGRHGGGNVPVRSDGPTGRSEIRELPPALPPSGSDISSWHLARISPENPRDTDRKRGYARDALPSSP